ncbi:MAG TPA: glycoside hydrolase family 3 N-terminal domain-containing protein, partial [Verrucomicrobiae bacterium]
MKTRLRDWINRYRRQGLRGLEICLLLGSGLAASAADEYCTSCGTEVSVSGDFTHRKYEAAAAALEGGLDATPYREEIRGTNFTLTLAHLPAGKYSVIIGEAAFTGQPGEQRFDVTVDDQALVTDYDPVAAAGGLHRISRITGEWPHEDDALKGPVKIHFLARQGLAKFHTCEVRDAHGNAVLSFSAAELADAFSAAAQRLPVITEPAVWRDPTQPLPSRLADLIRRLSLAEKVAQLKNAAPGVPRLGLPAYDYWNEALHGVANNGVATVFPEPVGAAASWNPGLFQQEGRIIGIEGRAKFNDYVSHHGGDAKWWYGLTFWAPNINIFRDPRWGRGQETYGEDPYLTGEIGVQFVQGMQGNDPRYLLALACAKHYAVHSGPEAQRHRFDVSPDERDLYETYLPQFERVVREGHVGGVMGAYNSVFGVPCNASPFLLDDLLRKKWGFTGYIVSDCDAIGDIWRQHHFVKTPEAAAAAAVRAGCDLCCGGDYNALVRAVQQGLITEAEIDQALYYTLWTRFKLGLFDPAGQVPYARYTLADNDTPEHQAVALDIARQSLVLLKNRGILPLDRNRPHRLAVIGPNANSKSMLEGNYHGTASHPITILAGLRQLAGPNVQITYAMGCPVTTNRAIAAW